MRPPELHLDAPLIRGCFLSSASLIEVGACGWRPLTRTLAQALRSQSPSSKTARAAARAGSA